jgi:3-oxoacyl-[acyl-carrier protein] reductase
MAKVIVTGGSRGLGLDIVRGLAVEGRESIAIARNQSPELEQTQAKFPGKITFVAFDLEKTQAIDGLVKDLRRQHGRIGALVNNAAIGIDGILTSLKEPDIEKALRINLQAPILLSKAVAKLMMVDGGGAIVNISSVNAATGYAGLSVYAATKAGLIGFTKSLARELGRAKITVNAVSPGLMETDMVASMEVGDRDKIMRRSPMQRFATTREAADAALFLLSNKATGITGSVITVDAGNSA